jgi:DNA mismatch endonuclease (patch repair protein)
MVDVFTKQKRSEVMAAVRSKGNKETEMKLAALLRASGITGWRRHQPLPGRPDFVFRRERLALFVDGCFWHGCRKHCRMPATNREYWNQKIARNIARDRSTGRTLKRLGFRVVRIWGHSLRHPQAILKQLTKELSIAHKRAIIRRNRK